MNHPKARRALILLTAVNYLNYIDRFILAAVLASIKTDMGLTDFQAGLLATAFMVPYMFTAPLFGWLGDTKDRSKILSLGAAVWSVATFVTGISRSFASILSSRFFSEGITPDIEVEDVDTDAFGKAIIKSHASREKDIQGHLLSEKEKNAEKNKEKTAVDAWWKDTATKKEANMTPKEKLLATDYQVYQAFNYIKAWGLMKGIGQATQSNSETVVK